MTNKEKNFIVKANDTIASMPSSWNRISWNNYPVEMIITDEGSLITKVNDKEYEDVCPMKGSRRNRKEIAKIVCSHICETWGGTMDEVSEYVESFFTELTAILNK